MNRIPLLACLALLAWVEKTPAQCTPARLPSASRITVEYLKKNLGKKGDTFNLTISYPQVHGSIFKSGETVFNHDMRKRYTSELQLYKKAQKEAESYQGDSSCTATPVNGRYLTIECADRADYQPSVHLYWKSELYTVDLRSGKLVTIADLGLLKDWLTTKIQAMCHVQVDPSSGFQSDPCDDIPICCQRDEEESPSSKNIVLGIHGILVSEPTDWYHYSGIGCTDGGPTGTPDFSYEELLKVMAPSASLKPFVDMIVKQPLNQRRPSTGIKKRQQPDPPEDLGPFKPSSAPGDVAKKP